MVKKILDLIFPSNIYCICCGNLINYSRSYAICDSCMEMISWADGRTCCICGKALNTAESDLCEDCKKGEHFFDRGYTCMVYGQLEKEMIHKFKFNGAAYMGEKLGAIMLNRISAEEWSEGLDMVTAVPMHPKKQRKRGYNQSELMAKTVAKGLGVVYNNQVLVRNSYKAAMNKLDAGQRQKNIIGAYGINERCMDSHISKDKSILLIDDIYTTGSTADECSRILKEYGAQQVVLLTLAAGAG